MIQVTIDADVVRRTASAMKRLGMAGMGACSGPPSDDDLAAAFVWCKAIALADAGAPADIIIEELKL